MIQQYRVYWVDLNPTRGSEIQKTRPCVIISPDEMNKYLQTVIVAPVTSTSRDYPTRVHMEIENVEGWIVLDQIRAIDKSRILSLIGELDDEQIQDVKDIIHEMLVE